ncbi:hypothetical protein [Shewanella sp. HL-SH2]|uniref:hypothetical protein n=1 Tax=Shewanella sp. HL-SH2 TaxID=3436238 RepID=UPI003EBECDE1
MKTSKLIGIACTPVLLLITYVGLCNWAEEEMDSYYLSSKYVSDFYDVQRELTTNCKARHVKLLNTITQEQYKEPDIKAALAQESKDYNTCLLKGYDSKLFYVLTADTPEGRSKQLTKFMKDTITKRDSHFYRTASVIQAISFK